MTVRTILTIGDPRLEQKSEPVSQEELDGLRDETLPSALRDLVNDMIHTMYDQDGVGLAAPQVGVLKRVIIVDVTQRVDREGNKTPPQPVVIINPEIVEKSKATHSMREGCLSIPGFVEYVERPAKIKLRGVDALGEPFEHDAEGILATAVQHEIDHLDGILFVERLSRLKKDLLNKKLKKSRSPMRIR